MKIRPRYGTDPLLTYEGDPAAVAAPAVRQRLRLARTLAGFGSQEWEAPSRCARWTNRDVVVHLASANRFWVHSISQARRGTPSQVLAAFDPVATPQAWSRPRGTRLLRKSWTPTSRQPARWRTCSAPLPVASGRCSARARSAT